MSLFSTFFKHYEIALRIMRVIYESASIPFTLLSSMMQSSAKQSEFLLPTKFSEN